VRIGELAHRAGVSVRSLRYYEEQDLVPAERTPGGHREYPESAVERVRFVQQLYSAGLASTVIAGLLPFLDTRVVTSEMEERLAGEHDRLQQQIDRLSVARDRLAELRSIAADAGGEQVPCATDAALPAFS
jgi:DNA-binding transcriptional MerR regulator